MTVPPVHSRVLFGMTAHPITIECHVGPGLPSTTIVGLPEASVRESRDRVQSAFKNCGFDYPDGRVVINLAPGHLAKSTSSLDLPIAISLLAATQQIRTTTLNQYEFLGELGLYGSLGSVIGVLACALAASQENRCLVIPTANTIEAGLAPAQTIAVAATLNEVINLLNGQVCVTPPSCPEPEQIHPTATTFDKVLGQHSAKRALTIAAAGGHHILMVGPPGTGKTMLARGFVDLLPALTQRQALEVGAIYSAAGRVRKQHRLPPFRDPHHSASAPALIGGGHPPAPGEAVLAHNGVLFLDELPHFKPSALDFLREPIETGEAVITRAKYTVRYPCSFQLVAAMNPCPAGRVCRQDACRCSPAQVRRYQSRISGPMLDRIDIQIQVPALPRHVLISLTDSQDTPAIQLRAKVAAARQRQIERQQTVNAKLAGTELKPHIDAANIDQGLLNRAVEQYQLSARSYQKLWRVARTIADLEGLEKVTTPHLTEALSYRSLEWEHSVS